MSPTRQISASPASTRLAITTRFVVTLHRDLIPVNYPPRHQGRAGESTQDVPSCDKNALVPLLECLTAVIAVHPSKQARITSDRIRVRTRGCPLLDFRSFLGRCFPCDKR